MMTRSGFTNCLGWISVAMMVAAPMFGFFILGIGWPLFGSGALLFIFVLSVQSADEQAQKYQSERAGDTQHQLSELRRIAAVAANNAIVELGQDGKLRTLKVGAIATHVGKAIYDIRLPQEDHRE